MSYRTIMVHVGSDPGAEDRLGLALAVGRKFGATVVGVGAATWDTYVDPVLGVTDAETVQALRGAVEAEIAAGEATFKAAVRGYDHPVAWRAMMDYPAMTLNRLACGADLMVASRKSKGVDDVRAFPAPGDLMMGSGLPVLLAASAPQPFDPSRILVGWKNSRETRRALTDALPLLKAAERVYLVQVQEKGPAGAAADAEMEDVIERLSRHGVFAEASVAPRLGGCTLDDLMDVAVSRRCGVTVLGAYGHSRLQEWVLGGVTKDALAEAPTPVLFSR